MVIRKNCSNFATLSRKSKGTSSTVKEHHEIETHLAYSKKLQELTVGHQQETAQLLKDTDQLHGDIQQLLDENKALSTANKAKDARIAELEKRVAELEARPNIITDHYFEHFTANQVLTLPQRGGKRNKSKQINNKNQLFLELWKDNPTAIL